jgi:hypothetical protein
MSGHHKFSELTKDFSPERKRRIKAQVSKTLAEIDREIHIPPIVLDWSDWHSWEGLRRRVHDGGVNVPDKPGVYEVRLKDEEKRLTIGRSKRLRARIKSHLVRESGAHSAGERIRTAIKTGYIDSRSLVIRWAITDRYAVAEAALHERHLDGFGELPKYTKST